MQNAKHVAYAIASLILWECNDADHLRELLNKWSFVDILTETEKEMVVQIVAVWPDRIR